MVRDYVKRVLEEVAAIKSRYNLKIVDSHVHPYDVMGAIHSESVHDGCVDTDYLAPGLLEQFKYSKLEKALSKIVFKFSPRMVDRMIKATYGEVNEDRVIHEMNASLVDTAVLLPVAPWLTTEVTAQHFVSDKFLILGTVDIHHIEENDIEKTIKGYIADFGIKGLKLHPNLQNFKPQPSHNPEPIASRLKSLYTVAANHKLYLLFHGGISNFTDIVDPKYPDFSRSKSSGSLEYFCDEDGRSELLGAYSIPIIIAHIGHYGITNPNYSLLKTIAKQYPDVFFDTSGVAPYLIQDAIEIFGSKRILFGSDALYNRIAFNVLFLYEAAKKANTGETFENIMTNILGNNFFSGILKK